MNHANTAAVDLQALAREAMRENGFEPDFGPDIQRELAALEANPPRVAPDERIRDLRALPWSSIDNESSRDLDQVEVAERLPDGAIRLRVAIADVDTLAPIGSALDRHAGVQTTTVYTGVRNFPML